MEADLDQVQENLQEATTSLEEAEKAKTQVSDECGSLIIRPVWATTALCMPRLPRTTYTCAAAQTLVTFYSPINFRRLSYFFKAFARCYPSSITIFSIISECFWFLRCIFLQSAVTLLLLATNNIIFHVYVLVIKCLHVDDDRAAYLLK